MRAMQPLDTPSTSTRSLTCASCLRPDDLERGWRLYLHEHRLLFVCPDCAERVLGEDER